MYMHLDTRSVLLLAEYRRKELRRAIVKFPHPGSPAHDERVVHVAAFTKKPLPLHKRYVPGA